MDLVDPDPGSAVELWWWQVGEQERDFAAGLAAAAAAEFGAPERLYGLWGEAFSATEIRRRYIEDLIRRVDGHLRAGTGVRRIKDG